LKLSTRRNRLSRIFLLGAAAALAGLAQTAHTTYGDHESLGNGYLHTFKHYSEDGALASIGVRFDESVLTNLPTEPNDGNNCYDLNGDGVINLHVECMGGHQRILFLPFGAQDTPFKWVLVNWNTHGHAPPGIYTTPHFDFHFFMQDYISRNLIRPGSCSMVIDCADYIKGKIPVPSQFMPPGYSDVDAVEVRMGNHLVDLSSPEFQPFGDFTQTFIFGAYEGSITFWEPMITKSFFDSKPNVCTDIPLPPAYELAGAYPTKYCVRYNADSKTYTVSLEGMQMREAQPNEMSMNTPRTTR
jgi:hypothetical protein